MESFIHTRRLADYLEMVDMGPSEFKKAVETRVPRELAYKDFESGKVENARELLQTEGLAATNLIPTEVYATVLEGSEPAKCFRSAIPTYRMPAPVMTVPYGETGTYAGIVAEGAEIPIETETISVATLTAEQYGVRPLISRAMVNDAKFDIIASEIRKAGYKIENAINRRCLEKFFTAGAADAGTYQTDCGGAGATPLAFTAKAVGTVVGRGFSPTDMVMCPVLYGLLLSGATSIFTQSGDRITTTGKIGQLFGMNTHLLGITETNATYNWGFAANGDLGAILYDRNSFGCLGIREDIFVQDYKDPVRDLVGMTVTARFDAAQLLVTAGQYVQF